MVLPADKGFGRLQILHYSCRTWCVRRWADVPFGVGAVWRLLTVADKEQKG